jgi:hypothetical protein
MCYPNRAYYAMLSFMAWTKTMSVENKVNRSLSVSTILTVLKNYFFDCIEIKRILYTNNGRSC